MGQVDGGGGVFGCCEEVLVCGGSWGGRWEDFGSIVVSNKTIKYADIRIQHQKRLQPARPHILPRKPQRPSPRSVPNPKRHTILLRNQLIINDNNANTIVILSNN